MSVTTINRKSDYNLSRCRVCLEINTKLYPLEGDIANVDINISTMITYCTSLEVEISEDLPKGVCMPCFRTIRIAYNFISQYKETHRKLLEEKLKHEQIEIEDPSIIEDDQELDAVDKIGNMVVHKNVHDLIMYGYSGAQIKSEMQGGIVQGEEKESHGNEEEINMEDDQNFEEIDQDGYSEAQIKLVMQGGIEQEEEKESHENEEEEIDMEDDQNFEEIDQEEISDSDRDEAEEDNNMVIYGDMNTQGLKSDLLSVIPLKSMTTNSTVKLEGNLLIVTEDDEVQAEYNHTQYTTEDQEDSDKKPNYILRRKIVTRFICPKCPDSSFASFEKGYMTHILLVHNNEIFNCNMCAKKELSVDDFLKHFVEVHRYQCPFCRKSFNKKGTQNHHMKLHSNIRYSCTYENCTKSFVTPWSLKKHMNTHSEQVKYFCAECGFHSSTYDNYRYHMKKHSGPKYLCTHCGRKFLQSVHLKYHMWVHTGIKQFKCDKCSKSYTSTTQLKKHKRRYHD